MSTIQKVKQKEETTIKTTISNDQSQKLVQTMMTMCFGCLAFLRGLFPDDNFVDQKFVPEKCNRDYDRGNASSIRIKTLVRNKSEEADLFLDWLEKGVFQSLKLGYLKAISLGIFVDENEPNNLLETYLFSFDYQEQNIILNINGQVDQISLLDSRKMVQQLMRRFIIITQSLDPLPEKRFLTMRLMFNDNAPIEYQPILFKDATRDPKCSIRVPQESSLDTFSVGSLDTSHHKIGVKVLSLADSAVQQQLATGLSTEIDPFDVLEDNIELPQETPVASQVAFQSQTSKMLQSYLKSSPVKFQPTQAMTSSDTPASIDCECNSIIPLQSSSKHLKCLGCKKNVHGLCYGNYRGSTIPSCIVCLSQGKLDLNSQNLHQFMMTRKLYRYMAKRPGFPNAVSDFYSILIDGEPTSGDKELINDALSTLLIDNVFVSEQEVRTRQTGEQLKCSAFINVDCDSIFSTNGLLPQGRCAWTFFCKAPKAQRFYTEPFARSEQHLTQLLKECDLSYKRLKQFSIDSSLTLNYLNINEKNTTPAEIKKRRYNEHEDDSTSLNFSHLDTQNEPSNKVRKISVSKKTLKSSW